MFGNLNFIIYAVKIEKAREKERERKKGLTV